jgi:hypothetical protein
MAWQAYTTSNLAQFVARYDTTNGYGLPVRGALAARQALSVNNDEVIAVIKGFPTPWNEQAAILRSVLADVPYRFLNSESDGLVLRPDKTNAMRYLFAPGTEPMLARLLQLARPERVQQQHFVSKADGTRYTVVQLSQPLGSAGFLTQPNPVWASRVELMQYRVTPRVNALLVEAVLRVLEPPPTDADFHWFTRAFVGQQQVGQWDGAGVHPASWREGDWVYLACEVPLPNDLKDRLTHIRFGSYAYPEVKPIMVSIPGQPAEDGVTLVIP